MTESSVATSQVTCCMLTTQRLHCQQRGPIREDSGTYKMLGAESFVIGKPWNLLMSMTVHRLNTPRCIILCNVTHTFKKT